MNWKRLLELAASEFPKPVSEDKVSPAGTPYKWLSYDFDEINEWRARWIQDHAEDGISRNCADLRRDEP